MTATTATCWKVLGKNDDVIVCECCGKSNLKLTVVLTDGESEVHYGRDCAARLLMGNNKPRNVKSVESLATAIEYARKWLKATPKHTADVIANAIRVRFAACHVDGEYAVEFDNGVKVSA